MNINQLNVIQNDRTTFNEIKKLNFVHLLDKFEAQNEGLCKRHCKGPALIFFDRRVIQRFYFSYTAPG